MVGSRRGISNSDSTSTVSYRTSSSLAMTASINTACGGAVEHQATVSSSEVEDIRSSRILCGSIAVRQEPLRPGQSIKVTHDHVQCIDSQFGKAGTIISGKARCEVGRDGMPIYGLSKSGTFDMRAESSTLVRSAWKWFSEMYLLAGLGQR